MSELSFTEFTDADDVDALHILPLRMIPLKNARLRRAKIVKNARLDGVVEIFSDRTTGSGEIDPISIMNALSFTEDEMSDVEIVQRLALLPSYDVYSLRIGLRNHGIQYMRAFTKPLFQVTFKRSRSSIIKREKN